MSKNQTNQTYEMKKLVQARYIRNFKNGKGKPIKVKIYRHNETQTGMVMQGFESTPNIYSIDLEAFYNEMNKMKEYELVEMSIQIKERKPGNADEAYETTTFENGSIKESHIGALRA